MTEYCPECDGTLAVDAYITGVVTRWHSDEYHATRRRQLLRAARHVLLARFATALGHRITIRFTAVDAWFECTCGASSGWPRLSSGAAVAEGRMHLVATGRQYLASPGKDQQGDAAPR